jgi:hypothetical protein
MEDQLAVLFFREGPLQQICSQITEGSSLLVGNSSQSLMNTLRDGDTDAYGTSERGGTVVFILHVRILSMI